MVHDGHMDQYDVAVVITNDSDLQNAMRTVRDDLKKIVGLICPADTPSVWLNEVASFSKSITNRDLRESQFPTTLRDGQGTFRRPKRWD